MVVELRLAVAVGVLAPVFLPHELSGDVSVRQLLHEVGKKPQERVHTLVRVGRIARMEPPLKDRVIKSQQAVFAKRVRLGHPDVLVRLVTADAELPGNLPV